MDAVVQGSGCGDRLDCALDLLEECSDCHTEQTMFGRIELVCVTIIYIPLMLLGLLGNILTILVVCLRPHIRTCSYLYLSSMAVSDLLILLLMPLDLYKLWRPRPWTLGDLLCKLTMFLSECCTFCTILHITFLSLERYLAVCWPITAKTLVTRRRTKIVIGCLWLGAALSAAPVLVMVGVEEFAASSGLLSAMMILSNLYFLVPFCILGLVYSLIGRTLWLRPKSNRKDQSNKSTVKMLGVIVLAFVLCWLPFHVGRTIFSLSLGSAASEPSGEGGAEWDPAVFNLSTDTAPTQHNSTHMMHPDPHMYFLYYLSQYFNLVSSVLFYLSAAINPLLYNLMSRSYRLAVRSLLQPQSPSHVPRARAFTIQQSSTTV
uniref:Growth hormone secretagogue receptor type 1 n=1 Tax=Knipowitschia caucasica TaxID=637954 RepID=A0AAV2KKP7_KNICA